MKFELVFVLLFISFFSNAQVQVQNLLIEQQANPVGIATLRPAISWQLVSDERNVKQDFYEILIASSKARLSENNGDVWSSGAVNSSKTSRIPYGGKPLHSNQYYFVKVKVRTNKGATAWSEPSAFTIGFVDPSKWKAQWIGFDQAFPWDSVSQWSRLSARYYRKEFPTSKRVKSAFVNLVGLGMYELMINGKKVGDQVLAPAPTDYRKSVLSNTFDVTDLIQAGQNAVGVVLGNGRFFTMRQDYKPHKINTFGFPKLLFQLDILYEDGSAESIVSDDTWKFTADGPIRTNNEYDGEEYNANKELGNWSTPGYGDSQWLAAKLVEAPEGKVVPQPILPMKVMQKIKPVSINKLSTGNYILDMGQNFAGWVQIKVKGNKGERVKLRFGESLQPDGELYVANLRDAKVTDIYTLKGEGVEVWHPTFVYHGFRYVEVSEWPGVPDINDFEGHLVYDDMETIGKIETSDSTLNQIVRNAWWGIASNYKGMPVDCPQRNERQPWLGDRAQGAYGESFLFNNASFYAKWLDDIEEAQTPEGAIPDVAPAFWNYYSDNVTWPGTYLLVAQMLYQQFGDTKSIVKHYPSMKKWITYMRDKYLKNDILIKDKYGDWCVPPEDLKMIRSRDSTRTTDGQLIASAYYYHLLGIMEDFARISNNDKDIIEYVAVRDDIKEAFNKKFFKEKIASYDNGTVTANLLPYYFGMVPGDNFEGVYKNILTKLKADNMHISTGVIGTQWLMRGLTRSGNADAAFTLASNRTYPSWGYMIESGATTIWELWNGNTANPQMNSQNHIMLLGDLLIWMFEDLGGIKAAKPGFKEIEMRPAFHSGLQYAKASYESVHGKIKSAWQLDGSKLIWEILIPANTSAIIYIPAGDISQITESGQKLTEAQGVELIKLEHGVASLKVQSGTYYFEVKN